MATGVLTAGWGLLIVGCLVAISGFLIGLRTVHGAVGDCGTGLSPRAPSGPLFGTATVDSCRGPLHARRVLTFALLGAGGGLVVLSLAGLVIPAAVVRRRDLVGPSA